MPAATIAASVATEAEIAEAVVVIAADAVVEAEGIVAEAVVVDADAVLAAVEARAEIAGNQG